MRLTVFGATGGTGTEVVRQALGAGHQVTAVVRDPARLTVPGTATVPPTPVRTAATASSAADPAGRSTPGGPTPGGPTPGGSTPGGSTPGGERFSVVTADVTDPEAISAVLEGADAVVSALGHRRGDSATICTDGVGAILTAMEKAGVRRLVAVSASGLFSEAGEPPLTKYVAKPLLQALLKSGKADAHRMEDLITESAADWTIMRPSRLLNRPRRPYQTSLDRYVSAQIGRADLAHAILNALDDSATIGHRVNVGY
jgi:putative NADH-flavin reductase